MAGDVRLVIAVGLAAKESVATWIKAHGGSAQPSQLENASLGSIPSRVRAIGVLHPGSASTGSTAMTKADFVRAIGRVKGWVDADSAWLPSDPGMPRNLAASFTYGSDAIPFRDFPFGVSPRLGGRGDVKQSKRQPARHTPVSSAGKYQAAGVRLADPSTATGSKQGYADDPGDLPYEPPRAAPPGSIPGRRHPSLRCCSAESRAMNGPTSRP